MHRRVARRLMLCAVILMVPAVVYGQARIAGVVRDPSGGVLPGVTVEAASPALIEKVRTVVTDGTGQIPDRRSSSRHLYAHVRLARLPHCGAGWHRAHRNVYR